MSVSFLIFLREVVAELLESFHTTLRVVNANLTTGKILAVLKKLSSPKTKQSATSDMIVCLFTVLNNPYKR